MIASLNVENIALIDKLQIDFAEGLNVLSGETGAGKSVLLDALNLILGERAERTLIRHGEEQAHVEALVYPDAEASAEIEALGIPLEDEIVVSRDLTSAGKSISRVNGRVVTLATMRSIMSRLVDLHGQHEHQSLLDPAQHTRLIDDMTGEQAVRIKDAISAEWKALCSLEREMAELGGNPDERAHLIEILKFQVDEVRRADIRDGELESLLKERKRLENAEQMKRSLYQGESVLKGDDSDTPSVMSGLRAAADSLKQFEEFDDRLPELIRTCMDAYYSIEDAAYTLSGMADSLEVDERRMGEIEERIELIRALQRKYSAQGGSQLNELADSWEAQVSKLSDAERRSREIESLKEDRRKTLRGLYAELSVCRKKAADRLALELVAELEQLGMKGAAFEVRFSGLDDGRPVQYAGTTPETAEFFLSVNKGEPLKPLSKVASGGEASRIMLAFKVISAEHDRIGTLIFDEIDTGISGRTAQVVGEKMAQVAMTRQIIAVTHLPQVAVMADRNFYIHKQDDQGRAVTQISELDAAGLRAEMVRLTGGIESQNAEAHAEEMMAQAAEARQTIRSSVGKSRG